MDSRRRPSAPAPTVRPHSRPASSSSWEAVEAYWRKHAEREAPGPAGDSDPTTRYAAFKSGEIDVTYWMTASLGEDLRRTPGLTLRPVSCPA